jgi:hypothetical protein
MLEPTTPEPVTGPFDPGIVPPAPDIAAALEPLLFEDAEPQLFDRPDPPPSKAEFELVLGHGIISGLTPGVLISVEPSGTLPRPEIELDEELSADGTFGGDVAPMPGVVVCAGAAATPIQQLKAASKSGYRIERPLGLADVSLTRSGKGELANV